MSAFFPNSVRAARDFSRVMAHLHRAASGHFKGKTKFARFKGPGPRKAEKACNWRARRMGLKA